MTNHIVMAGLVPAIPLSLVRTLQCDKDPILLDRWRRRSALLNGMAGTSPAMTSGWFELRHRWHERRSAIISMLSKEKSHAGT
jgi:hypothetical protein